MTPADYEIPDETYDLLAELEKFKAQNDTLIRQAGDMENLIHKQAESIRDLEAEVKRLKAENAGLKITLAAIPYDPPTPEQLEKWKKKFDVKDIKLVVGKWD